MPFLLGSGAIIIFKTQWCFPHRKSKEYEFPTSTCGKKRLRSGLKTLAKNGESPDDCWFLDVNFETPQTQRFDEIIYDMSTRRLEFKNVIFGESKGDRLCSVEEVSGNPIERAAPWFHIMNFSNWSVVHVSIEQINVLLRSPCLTRARGGSDSFWVTSHRRFMNLQDRLLLIYCFWINSIWKSLPPALLFKDIDGSQLIIW